MKKESIAFVKKIMSLSQEVKIFLLNFGTEIQVNQFKLLWNLVLNLIVWIWANIFCVQLMDQN